MAPLFCYASRGALLTKAFWSGWVEALVKYASWGVGAMPAAELPDAPLLFFLIMVTVYVAVIGYAVIRGLHVSARMGEVLLATAAAYGLASLLLFVNRSHPYNLCHAAVPFAVVITALISQSFKALTFLPARSALPGILAAGLGVLLVTKAEFRRYPSVARSFFTSPSPAGLSLVSSPEDVCGLPLEAGGFVREFNGITSAIGSIAPHGRDLAILDGKDTLLYWAANVCPWSRYGSLFYMALTKQSVEDMRNSLIERPPRWVVVRGQNAPRPPAWEFVWRPLYETVTNRYELRQTVGPYEIWQHSGHS